MFTKNTVLVLGAGASCHYGYPTGDDLIGRILKTIETGKRSMGPFEGDHLEPLLKNPDYKSFHERLLHHNSPSIDAFLTLYSKERPMIEVGKTMIVYEILKAENPNYFRRQNPDAANQRNEN
jgi:hypothetical protein